MKLVYRGIKYSSNNSTALKIVEEHKYKISRIINSKKFYKATITYKIPFYKYLKQLLSCNPNFVRSPYLFRKKYLVQYLVRCWQKSEIIILDSCWKLTLEKEKRALPSKKAVSQEASSEVVKGSLQKLKYRGVVYYK